MHFKDAHQRSQILMSIQRSIAITGALGFLASKVLAGGISPQLYSVSSQLEYSEECKDYLTMQSYDGYW
jgi:hypothetical protein